MNTLSEMNAQLPTEEQLTPEIILEEGNIYLNELLAQLNATNKNETIKELNNKIAYLKKFVFRLTGKPLKTI